jgi:DNA-binding MarR family transcriptional regulator/GNAT superfamily N-acetyltransferase
VTEARVLFELAHSGETEIGALRRSLDIDAGYLSRILARFEADGLVTLRRCDTDARRRVITLTRAGEHAFRGLDQRSAEQIGTLLDQLTEDEQQRLTSAMAAIQEITRRGAGRRRSYCAPPARGPGLGSAAQRRALRAGVRLGRQLRGAGRPDRGRLRGPRRPREAAWIAELDGVPAGCVFCMRKDDRTAQLRLLLVEPSARGLGLGGHLVAECLAFARQAGYPEIVLWTNDILTAARRIYQRAGFELVDSAPHHSFGHDLVGQNWRLGLSWRPSRPAGRDGRQPGRSPGATSAVS